MEYYCKELNCNNKVSGKNKRCQKCMGKIYSIKRRGRYNPNFRNGETLKKYFCKEMGCNNKITYESWKYGTKRCSSCAQKEYCRNNPKRHTKQKIYKISKNFLMKEYIQNKNPMFQIAKNLECNIGVIRNRLIEYNIPRRTRSEMTKGNKNPMFGKITHGKRSKYKNICMRSSWEIAYAKYLDKNNIKWLYESKRFDLGDCTYLPDFYLPKLGCYIEIKGYWRDNTKKRFDLFKKLYPNIKINLLMKLELKQLGVI